MEPGHISIIQDRKVNRSRINNFLFVLALTNTAIFIFYTLASYGLAPTAPVKMKEPNEAAVFAKLAGKLSFLGPEVENFVSGNSFLRDPEIWAAVYTIPVLVSTAVFLAALGLLAKYKHEINQATLKILFLGGAIFAGVLLLAAPVLAHDFWLSLAWGRMIAAGYNPYHTDFMVQLSRDLPLDAAVRMTYGPLWAVLSTVVMALTGDYFILSALLFKIILAGAWLGTLRLIWLLLRERSLWFQAVGILIFGWMPVSVLSTSADGHNDAAMVVFVLLWLYWLKMDKKVLGSLALAASVLVKYVTAPLFVLDFLHCYFAQRRRILGYLPQLAVAAGFMGLSLALFYRSPEFFDYLLQRNDWRAFRPNDALYAIEILTGIELGYIPKIALLIFPFIALVNLAQYVRKPDEVRFYVCVLAVLSAVLYSLSGFIWPWYLTFLLAIAALVPGTALTRWTIGVALAFSFPLVLLNAYPFAGRNVLYDIPVLALYGFALLWTVFSPRSWFPKT